MSFKRIAMTNYGLFKEELGNNNLDKAWKIISEQSDDLDFLSMYKKEKSFSGIMYSRGYRQGFDGNWYEFDTDPSPNNSGGGGNNDDGDNDCCDVIISLAGLTAFTFVCSIFLHQCCWCALWDTFWDCIDFCGCVE